MNNNFSEDKFFENNFLDGILIKDAKEASVERIQYALSMARINVNKRITHSCKVGLNWCSISEADVPHFVREEIADEIKNRGYELRDIKGELEDDIWRIIWELKW